MCTMSAAIESDTIINYSSDSLYPYKLAIAISNTDSGWGKQYNPTSEEINAYFNGWVMCGRGEVPYTSGNKYWYKRYQNVGILGTVNSTIKIETGTGVVNSVPIEKAYGDETKCYRFAYELTKTEAYSKFINILSLNKGINQVSILSEGEFHAMIMYDDSMELILEQLVKQNNEQTE